MSVYSLSTTLTVGLFLRKTQYFGSPIVCMNPTLACSGSAEQGELTL